MRSVNLTIQTGRVLGEIKYGASAEYEGKDICSFRILSVADNEKYNSITFCKVVGDNVLDFRALKEGDNVELEGRVKYKGSLGFVEANRGRIVKEKEKDI